MGQKNGNKSASGTNHYIPCRLEPGMFRDEFLVFLDALDPKKPNEVTKAQLLVDRRDVAGIRGTPKRNNPAPGWLRIVLGGSEGDWEMVILPQPSQPLGQSIFLKKGSAKKEPSA